MFVFLVADLIDRIFLSPAGIEPVREVQHEGFLVASVSIGVDNARGDKYDTRIGAAHSELEIRCGFAGPIFPEKQVVLSIDEREAVGLVNMFVGAASDSGFGDGEVGHGGFETIGELVISQQLGEPTAGVFEFLEGSDEHAFHWGVHCT